MRLALILFATLCNAIALFAQQSDQENRVIFSDVERSVDMDIIHVDTTLFRALISGEDDVYEQATRYYRAVGANNRRGLRYMVARQIIPRLMPYAQNLESPADMRRLSLATSNNRFVVGTRANIVENLRDEWAVLANVSYQSGRNGFVEGVFRDALWPELTLAKRWSERHYLSATLKWGYRNEGGHYRSTREAFELTNNNYYNPAWGLYNGKVRNAYVTRLSTPEIELRYQRPSGQSSTITALVTTSFDRVSRSSLGWYNATTPMPDYYRKMPSAMPAGQVRDHVERLWRLGDERYTQINWAQMMHQNSLSRDGSAYYVVENRVAQHCDGDVSFVRTTRIDNRLSVDYGARLEHRENRNFKVMDDLLGGDYLLDKDQFIGDSYNAMSDLDNNLLQPDNKVVEGDRFGYDYSLVTQRAEAIFGARFSTKLLDVALQARVSSQSAYRRGYFDKERFAGTASLGDSPTSYSSPYTLRARIEYALAVNQSLSLNLVSTQTDMLDSYRFIDATMANYLSPITQGEILHSASLGYHLARYGFNFDAQLYALLSRGAGAVYYAYDDLSSTMCRALTSNVAYHSIGAEVVASWQIAKATSLVATLSAGCARYDDGATVSLYNQVDLSCISHCSPIYVGGTQMGNTPQVAATLAMSHFFDGGYSLNIATSYSALRYVQASMVRRSERHLFHSFVDEQLRSELTAQERLPDIFDMKLSLTKSFWLANGSRISLYAALDNLLGDRDRIIYARESDRVALVREDDAPLWAKAKATTYQYGAGRTIYISASYNF